MLRAKQLRAARNRQRCCVCMCAASECGRCVYACGCVHACMAYTHAQRQTHARDRRTCMHTGFLRSNRRTPLPSHLHSTHTSLPQPSLSALPLVPGSLPTLSRPALNPAWPRPPLPLESLPARPTSINSQGCLPPMSSRGVGVMRVRGGAGVGRRAVSGNLTLQRRRFRGGWVKQRIAEHAPACVCVCVCVCVHPYEAT